MIRDRTAPMLLALAAFVAAQALLSAGWLNGVNGAMLGVCFRLRGDKEPAPEITIVSVDPVSLRSDLGQGRGSESDVYAALIERLHQAGAEAVAFDIPLVGIHPPDASDEDEKRLARAMDRSGNVVLPCMIAASESSQQFGRANSPDRFAIGKGTLPVPRRLLGGVMAGPSARLLKVAAGVGHVNLYPDADGVIRSIPLATSAEGKLWPSLALEAARVYRHLPAGSIDLKPGRVTLGETALAITPAAEMMINYAGGYQHYPHTPLRQVLRSGTEALEKAVRGKIVLVGLGSGTTYWRTPVHPVMPGVDIMANAIGNVLQGNELRQPSPMIPAVLALIAAILTALVISAVGSYRGAIAALLLLFTVCIITHAFLVQGIWLPMATPLLAILLAALTTVVQSATVADRARVQAEAAFDSRMEAITGIGSLIASSTNRTNLLPEIIHWVESELDVPAVSILLVDERRRKLEFELASGRKGDEVKSFSIELGEGIAGAVAQTGRPLIVNQPSEDPRYAGTISDAVDYPVHSILCVPIMLHGEVLGVIEALNKASGPFTARDQDLLTLIAQQAALFLETARLYTELARRVDRATEGLKSANRRLATQKSRLETLLDEMDSGVIATDSQERVVTWNNTVERLLGETESRAMGQPALAVIKHPRLSELIAMPLSPVGGRHAEDVDIQTSHGTVTVRASVTLMADAEGFGKLILLTDITQLKELDRLKTDLISFVSHELQNPLTSIRGFAHLLQQKTSADSPNMRLIQFLNQQTTRMQWLVEDFLDVSRIESASPLAIQLREVDDVGTMIRRVTDLYRLTTDDHNFVIDVRPGTPPFLADGRKLEQVLVNLVENAVKYSPDGGEVRLTVEPKDDEVILSVSDEGIGISEDELPNLFQRFRRAAGTRERISGTGIGLFLSRSLIEAQDGRIWAETRERGTTFRVALPVTAPQHVGERSDDEANTTEAG